MAQYASYSGYGGSGGGGGGVSSVTATSPVASSGGANPNISITQAGSSTSGYLSSTDWNIFNNKHSIQINKFTLSPTDISNKFVTLSQSPQTASLTCLEVIGGPEQEYGTDFTVSGSTLSWSGLFLDGVLSSGDLLIVIYY